jgi:hypothetical protein
MAADSRHPFEYFVHRGCETRRNIDPMKNPALRGGSSGASTRG